MTPDELRDIDRRIAVAKGWTLVSRIPAYRGTEWRWKGPDGSYREHEHSWYVSADTADVVLPSHTDPAEAFGLLRELVEEGVSKAVSYHRGRWTVGDCYVDVSGYLVDPDGEADTLGTAIALAWLATFEEVPA